MTRLNVISKTVNPRGPAAWANQAGALAFGALLIVLSITVGCSSEKPKSVSSNQNSTAAPTPAPMVSTNMAPAPLPESKPAKKVVRKRPATVNYSDKNFGVTFEYPRRYAIETGDAANALVSTSFLPMNFVQPGGVALAAVELPVTGFANTDFSSAYFDVSVNKNLTVEQCGQFAVPQAKAPVTSASDASKDSAEQKPAEPAKTDAPTATKNAESAAVAAAPSVEPQGGKLLLGDMELRGTEAVSGEGNRQSDSKYFHAYQNGVCYEFGLNVTTIAREDGMMKHVDRDKVFTRLEQILSTVKINPIDSGEKTAGDPAPAPEKSGETTGTSPASTSGESNTAAPATSENSPTTPAPTAAAIPAAPEASTQQELW